ncbi:hypothetical protein [Rhodanobacter sp. C01]|uniref:hypothetical protein n=1 Tax=Rhodanobacter sp. C01 TaxID=1945856 RepID=UPI001115742A|nr:hypothetical protein [Rhodanobacter sp. C01]
MAIVLCTPVIHYGLRLFGISLPLKASFDIAWVPIVASALLALVAGWVFYDYLWLGLTIVVLFQLWFCAVVVGLVLGARDKYIVKWKAYLLSIACLAVSTLATSFVVSLFIDS